MLPLRPLHMFEFEVQGQEAETVVERLNFIRETCASCRSGGIKPLMFVDEKGIPPAMEGHAIVYSQLVLSVCQICGCGQIEKFEHDCFDWEDLWNQYEWYLLDPPDMARLMEIVRKCPNPVSPACDCPIHTALRSTAISLPTASWYYTIDATLHVHWVSLQIEKGLPKLRVKE